MNYFLLGVVVEAYVRIAGWGNYVEPPNNKINLNDSGKARRCPWREAAIRKDSEFGREKRLIQGVAETGSFQKCSHLFIRVASELECLR